MTTLEADIVVLGAGLGGCAAALSAAAAGKRVILTESAAWIGGQIGSQGVSALDEHAYIETFGGTADYDRLRALIRAHYQRTYGVETSNPGGGWVSRLCFEPRVGVQVLESMLAPHVEAGRLQIVRGVQPMSAAVAADSVQSVRVAGANGRALDLVAAYYLDATELGDLLPLAGADYVTGAESQTETGEPHAPSEARPGEVQAFTFSFVVEFVPSGDFRGRAPRGYEAMRDAQPFTLTLPQHDGSLRRFYMFAGELPFWSYRRIFDGAQLGGRDLALINWASNDYYGASILDQPLQARAQALDEAKRLTLGFLHWLRTECPRDDGGSGYPELRLRPDVMGTADGLSQMPYIREARRLRALTRICEQDITAAAQPGARARLWTDSVGIGWYSIDLHACVGNPHAAMYAPTRPFQLPLGALIPCRLRNMIPACKNIGTTHLTNGAYRLHPVEWAVGASAGMLAAYACDQGHIDVQACRQPAHLRRLQMRLIDRGTPLAWAVDVPRHHPHFASTQMLLLHGIGHDGPLTVLDQTISTADLARAGLPPSDGDLSWAQACTHIAGYVEALRR